MLLISTFQRDVTKISPLIEAQLFSVVYYGVFSLFSFDDFKFPFVVCIILNCYVCIILSSLKDKFKEEKQVCTTLPREQLDCRDFYDALSVDK